MKKLFTIILLNLIFYSCASTHPGNKAKALDEKQGVIPLVVSARTISLDKNDPFQLVEITTENVSYDWIKISETEVKIQDLNEPKISIVLGKDLDDWAQAMQNRKEKSTFNNSLIQMLGLIGGTGLYIFSKNEVAKLVGLGVAAGASTWSTVDAFKTRKGKAEGVVYAPDTHFLTPFSLPGSSYLRRWILFNKPVNVEIKKLVLTLKTVEGKKDSYVVEI